MLWLEVMPFNWQLHIHKQFKLTNIKLDHHSYFMEPNTGNVLWNTEYLIKKVGEPFNQSWVDLKMYHTV